MKLTIKANIIITLRQAVDIDRGLHIQTCLLFSHQRCGGVFTGLRDELKCSILYAAFRKV